METPLDEQYLIFLYSKIASTKTRRGKSTYWSLAGQLHSKEFVWFVPNDDNRVEDGRDLRNEFRDQEQIVDIDEEWMSLGCSILELMIGLSRRLAFEAGGSARVWFWELIDNLEMTGFHDSWWREGLTKEIIDERLDRLIWRTYLYDGSFGGLFPLKNPAADQRDIELWYQLCQYLLERA